MIVAYHGARCPHWRHDNARCARNALHGSFDENRVVLHTLTAPAPMPRTHLTSPSAPAAIGPYSHGVWAGELLYLSGQTPIDPATGRLIDGDVQAQTHRVFDNLDSALRDAGLTMHDVIKCNVYLTDMSNFPDMNVAYASRFDAPFPARTTVAVAGLPLGASVEIELVARKTADA